MRDRSNIILVSNVHKNKNKKSSRNLYMLFYVNNPCLYTKTVVFIINSYYYSNLHKITCQNTNLLITNTKDDFLKMPLQANLFSQNPGTFIFTLSLLWKKKTFHYFFGEILSRKFYIKIYSVRKNSTLCCLTTNCCTDKN